MEAKDWESACEGGIRCGRVNASACVSDWLFVMRFSYFYCACLCAKSEEHMSREYAFFIPSTMHSDSLGQGSVVSSSGYRFCLVLEEFFS